MENKRAAEVISDRIAKEENLELETMSATEINALKKAYLALYADDWHGMEETPPFVVGELGYTGYLVAVDGQVMIADYTTDKYSFGVPEFHVDGEYEPDVEAWRILPKPPKEETL